MAPRVVRTRHGRRADSAEPSDTEPKIRMMPQTATMITVRSRLEIFSVARSGADAWIAVNK